MDKVMDAVWWRNYRQQNGERINQTKRERYAKLDLHQRAMLADKKKAYRLKKKNYGTSTTEDSPA